MSSCATAAFHSAELYGELAAAVPQVADLLRDAESRYQANAAGALGNLSRHADTVVPAIVQSGAVQVG